MPSWAYVALAAAGWCAAAVLVGLALGAVIRRRDRGAEPAEDHDRE